jgi:diketogulonate reductase-like aldo/keto reductase
MEKLVGTRLRSIGVSNFSIENLEKLSNTARIPPSVNQVIKHKDQNLDIRFTYFLQSRLKCIPSYVKKN